MLNIDWGTVIFIPIERIRIVCFAAIRINLFLYRSFNREFKNLIWSPQWFIYCAYKGYNILGFSVFSVGGLCM